MSITQAIVLGLIQGLTEFLPISSSGHLVLAPWFFNWTDPGLAFDVALHLGTLLAVIIYFFKDFIEILKEPFQKQKTDKIPLLYLLIIATIPGSLTGYFLEEQAETIFRNPLIVATTLIIGGALLYLADYLTKKTKSLKKITTKNAIIIGLAQALAIVPGVSRSGATITAGLFLKFDRISAARFSFLLSAPIIFGATVAKFKDFWAAGIGTAEIVGIFCAALSGYVAIAGLIKFVQKVSYKIFFWYRLALAILIVIFWINR